MIMAQREQMPEKYQSEKTPARFPSPWANLFLGGWPEFFDENLMSGMSDMQTQGVRIYEEKNELHVEAPLPGLNSKDIEVSINKGVLWIKGQLKEEEKDKEKKFYRSSKRNYAYSIVLPTQTDQKQEPQAVYSDGILKVSLKLEKREEPKKITVKAGNGNKK